MLTNIPLGIYFPGNSLLHRLQARTKLLLLLWVIIALVIAGQHWWHFVPFVVMIVLVVIGVTLSSISPRELLKRMWLLIVLTVLGAFTVVFVKQDTNDKTLYSIGPFMTSYAQARNVLLIGAVFLVLLCIPSFIPAWRARTTWLRRFRVSLVLLCIICIVALVWFIWKEAATGPLPIGPLLVTYGGVWVFVSLLIVLLVLYTFSLLLTMTTSPVALIEGLTILLAPLRLFRLPVDDFALMTLLALRFIPTLLEEVELLVKAQAARGADATSGTIRERLQNLSMLFVPLMQGVFRRASELATALEARGYEVEGRQTRLYEKSFGLIDYVTLGVVVLAMVGALLL